MSLYLGENCISAGGSSAFRNNNIGEIIQSTIPLSDAGLHLLDGSLISGSGSYADFVTYIAGLVSTYPDLFETEANWQQSVTDYGVCGKFVYDSNDNTVRLPKITGFTEGTLSATSLGDLTEAGLPNITGFFGQICYWNQNNMGGAFKQRTVGGPNGAPQNTAGSNGSIDFDASGSNSIYGNSSTVQPQSIKVLYYICIATSTKTNIEVDIDQIATDLNGKADVDLTNVNNSGTSLGASWAMPSNTYDDLTLGASGSTYTAPADGYFCLEKLSNADNQYLGMSCLKDGETTAEYGVNCWIPRSGNGGNALLPIKKGRICGVGYNAGITEYFRFIYAVGSEWEKE